MATPTYKHLEGRTLVGPFSLGQWLQLVAGVVLGLAFAVYLSPFPAGATIFLSSLIPGMPLAASYGAMGLEFSLTQVMRAGWRHWRRPRRYLPGPGSGATGYLVEPDPDSSRAGRSAGTGGSVERPLEALWDM